MSRAKKYITSCLIKSTNIIVSRNHLKKMTLIEIKHLKSDNIYLSNFDPLTVLRVRQQRG